MTRHNSFHTQSILGQPEAEFLVSKSASSKLIIEVGSWKGGTSSILCDHMPSDGRLHCVDCWITETAQVCEQIFRINNYFNVESGRLIIHHKTSDEAFSEDFSELGPVCDLVFIDGLHTYRQVYQDIYNYKTLVRPGGILCGDDYYPNGGRYVGIAKAVSQLVPNPQCVGNMWWAQL